MAKNMKLSIAIPIHGMERGDYYLQRCLDSILEQSFQDYEVVITDNSDDEKLERIIRTYAMPIRYIENPRKGMAPNTNEAIKASKGQLIKLLYMDDYLAHKDALKDIVGAFRGYWLVTPADNNRKPHYTQDIHLGNNKLGSPSALTILNEEPLLFDEEMTWLLDCDYYKRMFERFGLPVILDKVGVKMGIHEGQMSYLLTDEEKNLEQRYMINKYA
jgi:glycosyltransferase involved in cell wall biosynthesis